MKRPVFVLSTGRCGTLALQRFLNKSNGVEAFHRYRGRKAEYRNDMSFVLEQNFAYYRALQDGSGLARRLSVRLLRSSRSKLMERVASDGKGFVELNHEFAPFGPLLIEAFPAAKFIHLYRDPRPVVTSFLRKFDPPPMTIPAFVGTRFSPLGQYVLRHGHFRRLHGFFESHRYDTQLHPLRKVRGRWKERTELSPFERTCWYWNAVNKVCLDFLDQLEEERKLSIKFETFFDQAESFEPRVRFTDFVGISDLSASDAAAFFDTPTNVKEVHHDFPHWNDWNDDMLETMNRLCGESMSRMGYLPLPSAPAVRGSS